jgi:hypothetical protein
MPAIRLECSYHLNVDYGASVGSPKVKTRVYVIVWWCGTEYAVVTTCLFWSTAPFEACYAAMPAAIGATM